MEIIKKNNISEIITALKNGAVLVFPTDTVYGLICDAGNKKAVDKIYSIKKREKSKPLGVFVKDIKTIKNLAFIDSEKELIFKDNKITFILDAKKKNLSPTTSFRSNKTFAVIFFCFKLFSSYMNEVFLNIYRIS